MVKNYLEPWISVKNNSPWICRYKNIKWIQEIIEDEEIDSPWQTGLAYKILPVL